jgi:hypothetical protein
MTKVAATIIYACTDEALFAGWFRDLATWRAWFAFLRTLFGLPMSEDERVVFKQCTGRDDPPEGVTREAWLIVGRRGGKSIILALTAVFLACFIDWLPGFELGTDVTITRWPDRYMDPRGLVMWQRVTELLQQLDQNRMTA